MKKIILISIVLFATKLCAQIHPINLSYYSSPSPVSEAVVETRIEYLLNTFLPNKEYGADPEDYFGDMSIYYSKRVISHVQLYEYYSSINNQSQMTIHENYLDEYLDKLLGEQCVTGYDPNICSGPHGGFPSPGNTSTFANPKVTAEALQALVSAKFFYEKTSLQAPISLCELDERIILAKDAMLAYTLFNDHYTNLTAFGFIASASLQDYYGDFESYQFLETKGNILLNGLPPLKSNASTTGWNLAWDEGYQADGSWKVFGYDGTNNLFPNDLCSRWHDSEAIYHAAMIEGLAELFRSLNGGTLKENAKEKLINAINHIIDYNGEASGIIGAEATSGPNGDYENSRLSNNGLISNYHRETDNNCIPDEDLTTNPIFKPTIETQGYGYIVALIRAKKALEADVSTTPSELAIIDNLIHGLAKLIFTGMTYRDSRGMTQLVDLSYYLNRSNYYDTKKLDRLQTEELVISFDNSEIYRFKVNTTTNILTNYETFYDGSKLTEKIVSGDFNGNGEEETIVAFDKKDIYRYYEDITENFVQITPSFYQNEKVVHDMVVGDFNGDRKDEAIIALDNGSSSTYIYRYHEDATGNFVQVALAFYTGTETVQGMTTGDFNGDGKDEVIIAFDGGTSLKPIFRYHENDQNGTFEQVSSTAFYAGTQKIKTMATGDFDCDGKDEAIIAFEQGLIYRYYENQNGTFEAKEGEAFYQGGQIAQHITVGDYNGDGKDEVIISFADKTIFRFQEDATGYFEEVGTTIYTGTQLTEKMVSGDFNGNGKDEAIIAFDQGSIYGYHENSSGNFVVNGSSAFYLGGTGIPKIQNISVRVMDDCSNTFNVFVINSMPSDFSLYLFLL